MNIGYQVLACDLDPQANLTAAFLDEDHLEMLWDDEQRYIRENHSAMRIQPLTRVGDIQSTRTLARISQPNLISGNLNADTRRSGAGRI